MLRAYYGPFNLIFNLTATIPALGSEADMSGRGASEED